MIVVAIALIAVGVVTGLLGAKLFKLLLPVLGLITGFMVGYIGFQGVFGTGAVSTAMAVVIALFVGLLLAVLSYVFFSMAVVFLAISVGATAFSYLGVALGLREQGFVMFLLALSGAIMVGYYALTHDFGLPMVIVVTSMLGTAYVLAGVLLVAGDVTVNEVADNGVLSTTLRVVDQSLLWLLAWVGGSLFVSRIQHRLLLTGYGSDAYQYSVKRQSN